MDEHELSRWEDDGGPPLPEPEEPVERIVIEVEVPAKVSNQTLAEQILAELEKARG